MTLRYLYTPQYFKVHSTIFQGHTMAEKTSPDVTTPKRPLPDFSTNAPKRRRLLSEMSGIMATEDTITIPSDDEDTETVAIALSPVSTQSEASRMAEKDLAAELHQEMLSADVGGALDDSALRPIEKWEPEFVYSREASVWWNREVSALVFTPVIPADSLSAFLATGRCVMDEVCVPTAMCSLHKYLTDVVYMLTTRDFVGAVGEITEFAKTNRNWEISFTNDFSQAMSFFLKAWKTHFYLVKHYIAVVHKLPRVYIPLYADLMPNFVNYVSITHPLFRIRFSDLTFAMTGNPFHKAQFPQSPIAGLVIRD